MDLTTVARVKALIPKTTAEDDAILQTLVTAASQRVASKLGRHVEDTGVDRTEVYTLRRFGRVLLVKGYPVASVTTVKYSATRDFTASSELVDNEGYLLDSEAGAFRFLNPATAETNHVQVVYQGGMATSTATFITSYPDIAEAVDFEVVNRWRRRSQPAGDMTFGGGGITFNNALMTLADLERVIDLYRRRNWS